MSGDPAGWRPIALPNLPPGHTAWEGTDDGSLVIRISGLDGVSILGHGGTRDEAVGNARAKLKLIGGLLAPGGSPAPMG